jgi:RNA polymerase sigma-70 factor (ECF subfamily)
MSAVQALSALPNMNGSRQLSKDPVKKQVKALSEKVSDLPDATLVARSKDGDAVAFGELVHRSERIVYNLAYRYMRDPNLAEDMAQEAFLKAYRLLGGFRGDCSFSTWLYRVTCSVCLTELNRRKKRGEVELLPSHSESAVPAKEYNDTHDVIRRCVTKLPERYASIVTLYYLQEISYDEIAKIMNIPMGTLKTWMHRARNQLKQIVEKELGPSEQGQYATHRQTD